MSPSKAAVRVTDADHALRQQWPASTLREAPLADLVPAAANARTHSAKQIDQIARSMKARGWTSRVLIDEQGMIIAGHGRVLAAQQLVGKGHSEFSIVPTMIAAGWSDEEKRAYVIADNQLALASGWDTKLLVAELGELSGAGIDMGLLGFSEDYLARKIGSTTAGPQLGDDLAFRVVIECDDEQHQARLLERFAGEGLECKALIS